MGLCPCPRQRGKRLQRQHRIFQFDPAHSQPPDPDPRVGRGGEPVVCVHKQVVLAEAELGQATHHRLHREKVVRPRCAVRLAAAHTGRASWSMACSSLGQQALPNPLTPTLELPPRAQTAQTAPRTQTETQKGSGRDRQQAPRLSTAFLWY